MTDSFASSIEGLIERCLAGDQAAWEQIVKTYRRKVFNVAYTFVGRHHEAEDLTQDILLKVFRSLASFDRRANFQTWLISVSRNLCIDHYRSVHKERETVDARIDARDVQAATPEAGPYAALELGDRRALLRRALEELPPVLRNAVLLRDIRELPYHQIADQLGVPEGTVKSRINRGRLELARAVRRIEHEGRSGAEPARRSGARK